MSGSDATQDSDSSTLWVVGMAVALLALAGWMGWECYPAWAAGSWPTAEGKVTARKMFEHVKVGASTPQDASIELTYEYTVDGKQYTGTRFNTRNNYLPLERAPAVARQYAVGASCQVRYSPWLPSESFIETELTWHFWVKLLLGGAALLGALFCGWIALPSAKPASN